MKKLLFSFIMALMPFLLYSQCDNLYIAGVFDGPLAGGTPKGVQVCASGAIADLSIYGIGSANNGGGTDGEEFTFPNAALSAGECVWVASEADLFNAFFGFDPCYVSGTAGINGDDAIELFCSGTVIDVFGDIATDGNGEPWEYTDGWAVSSDMVASTTFDANWTYSGINALDGATDNASAASPYPNAVDNCPVSIVDCPALSLNFGDDCDDMDAGTYADSVDVNCMCAGIAFDCAALSLNIGNSCDDGDPATLNDTVDVNCICAGTSADCPILMLNIGDTCNDNDPSTAGDVVDGNCDCVGTPITGGSDLYFSELSFNPCTTQGNDGDCEYVIISNNSEAAIDIGDYTLSNGITYTFPAGTMIPASGSLSVGVSSNCAVFAFDQAGFVGSLSNSNDETIDLNDASGTLVTSITYVGNIADGDCNAQCFDLAGGAFACPSSVEQAPDCPTLNLNIGASCDDMDATTMNDTVDVNCVCAGSVPTFDCPTEMVDFGSSCDDGDATTANDTIDTNCMCVGTPFTPSELYISELSYNPCTEQGNDGDCEYIVITNSGTSDVDLSDYTIANGFTYTFPAGTMISAGGTLSLGISGACAGFNFDLAGDWSGSMSNSSNETIELNDASGALVTSVTYDGTIADGDCMSQCFDAAGTPSGCTPSVLGEVDCPILGLNIGSACDDMDATTMNDTVDVNCVCAGSVPTFDCPTEMVDFGSSCDDGDATTANDTIDTNCMCVGTPFTPSELYISELSYNPCTEQGNDGDCEYIVITNSGTSDVDLSDYTIANGFTYTFPAGTMISAGGTLSLGISGACAGFNFDLAGDWSGSMSNSSNETIELNDASGALVTSVTYDGTIADGDCMSQCFDAAGTPSGCTPSVLGEVDCPILGLNIGSACDDMDATTMNDTVDVNCVCAGSVPTFDCPTEMVDFGSSCDDGDATTANDTIDTNCMCVGTPFTPSELYISELSYNPCTEQGNDGDCEYIVITNSGTSDVDLSDYTIANGFTYTFPAGTMISAGGTLSLGISGACAGFNFDLAGDWSGSMSNSSNETIELNDASGALVTSVTYDGTIADGDCMSQCFDAAGTPSGCTPSVIGEVDCPILGLNIGSACDDMDATTFGDVVDANCMCVGTPYDCPALELNIGDACDDMDPMTVNDSISATCECVGVTASTECPAAFINEFHYDNDGGDLNELLEIAVPIGADASGLTITLYNGNGGVEYNSIAVGAASPAGSDATYDYYVVDITGAQNGNDGFALSCADGTVLDFISYEGAFDATDGPAVGMTATDVVVAESSSGPDDVSLQLIDGVWQEPCTSTFGATNDTAPCFVAPCDSNSGNFPWTGN